MIRARRVPHRRPTARAVVRRLPVAGVLAAAGVLFVTSAQTSRGTDLRSEGGDLTALVREESARNATAGAQLADLRAEVDALTRARTPDGAATAAEAAAAELAAVVGTRAVHGPGLVVTLDDAPSDQPAPAGAAPDDLVVHQQDVQAVVNALWAAGAEAMVVMDQRIISTSAVRCVGNVLILQGRTYSPPYRIAAVGDPEAMQAALDASPTVSVYRQYVQVYGLGYEVERVAEVRAPAFDGTVALRHARPVEGAGA